MSETALDYILSAASSRPLLTATQEIELGRLIRTWQDWPGGPDQAPPGVQRRGQRALDRFVTANIRLAYFCARKYEGRGVPLADLTQSAIIGLRTAYLRFRPELGNKSSSFAIWYGRQACQLAVARESGSIRLPIAVSEALRRATRATERLRVELGRCPTTAEIAAAAGMSQKDLEQLSADCLAVRTVSLDAGGQSSLTGDRKPCDAGSLRGKGRALMDTLTGSDDPQDSAMRNDLAELLRKAIAEHPGLTHQQRYILRCRYLCDGKPPSLPSLASRLNMKRESVRAMERSALRILKRHLRETGIDAFPLE